MIVHVNELPPLPEGALGFGPNGWQVGVFEQVTIQRNSLTLQQVMDFVLAEHGPLLGEGELRFYYLPSPVREPKGYIVFVPGEEPDGDT